MAGIDKLTQVPQSLGTVVKTRRHQLSSPTKTPFVLQLKIITFTSLGLKTALPRSTIKPK